MPDQVIHLPFRGGVDEKSQAVTLEPGPFRRLSNLVQNKTGSVQKRRGHTALSMLNFDGTTITAGKKFIGFRDEALAIDGHNLDSFAPTAGAWKTEDQVPEPLLSRMTVAASGTQPGAYTANGAYGYDSIYVNGYYVVTWQMAGATTGQVTMAEVIDASNGQIVSKPRLLITEAVKTRLVSVGNRAILLWHDAVSAPVSLQFIYIDLGTAAAINTGWTGYNIIRTDLNGAELDAVGLTDRFAVVYKNTAAAPNTLSIVTFDNAGTVLQTTTRAGGVGLSYVGIAGIQTDTLWIAWTPGGAATYLFGVNPTTISSTIATQVLISSQVQPCVIVRTTAGGCTAVTYDTSLAATILTWRSYTTTAGATVAIGGVRGYAYRLTIASRPFYIDGRTYVMAADNSATRQDVLICMDVSDDSLNPPNPARPVATVAPRLAVYAATGLPSSVGIVSATKVAVPYQVRRSNGSFAIELGLLDFAAPNRWQPAYLGDALCMSGGTPTYYDGARVCEQGFIVAPPKIAPPVLLAGPLTGNFQWCAVYCQIDTKGQIHRSSPSIPSATAILLSPGTGLAQVVVPTLQTTSRTNYNNSTRTFIEIYRTLDSQTTFFLSGIVDNDPTKPTVTFNDSTTTMGQLMYTQPAAASAGQVTALPKVCPPSLSGLITHGDRLVGWAGKDVFFSGPWVSGEGPWWSDNFQFPISIGGDITAMASISEGLVVFKADPTIAIISGDGPPDSGIGGDFSAPRYIATDVGCTEPRSVIGTPLGVFFRSARGIELLNSSLQVEPYFGRAVEDTLAANPVITSAVLRDADGRVEFTCLPSEVAATGVKIIYDLVHSVWTTAPLIAGAVSADLVGEAYHFVTAAGQVYKESPTDFMDAGTWVPAVVETVDYHVAGLQGFQRMSKFMLWCSRLTEHGLTVEIAYDGSSTFTETHTFTRSQIASLDREELEGVIGKPMSQSIRFRISDVAPPFGAGGTGQGAVFIQLALSVSTETGMARRHAAARG